MVAFSGDKPAIIEITVPDLNDSYSRVVLDGTQYLIRFTWSMAARRWAFGLYTMLNEPIAIGIKLVPRFPLNYQIVDERFPTGVFGVFTDLDVIERNTFNDRKAAFAYIPLPAGG